MTLAELRSAMRSRQRSPWASSCSFHQRLPFPPRRHPASVGAHRGQRVDASSAIEGIQSYLHSAQQAAGVAALAGVIALAPLGKANATTDTAAVGGCLLRSCQTELATCISDGNCLRDLICLQGCNGRPDEKECQIRCGDLYEDQAVTTFNSCAVSEKKCVPQQSTPNAYPVPPDSVLDTSFDINQFQGRWYITAGYNKLFDTFDCQEHYFMSPPDDPSKLYGKIQWRISRPDGDFLERSTVQRFVQDPANGAKLYNHDNVYLHYEDDWYVAAWKPDEYAFIYYKGNNDAWKGYGGATVYTRAASFPREIEPEMRRAAESIGLKWEDFTITDNSCKPHPRSLGLFSGFFDTVRQFEASLVREFEDDLASFGRGFTVLESSLEQGLSVEGELLKKELKEAGKLLNRMERSYNGPFASLVKPRSTD